MMALGETSWHMESSRMKHMQLMSPCITMVKHSYQRDLHAYAKSSQAFSYSKSLSGLGFADPPPHLRLFSFDIFHLRTSPPFSFIETSNHLAQSKFFAVYLLYVMMINRRRRSVDRARVDAQRGRRVIDQLNEDDRLQAQLNRESQLMQDQRRK